MQFWPDPQIFVETLEFRRETLAERLRELAFLNKGTEIKLVETALQRLQVLAPGLTTPGAGASASPAP